MTLLRPGRIMAEIVEGSPMTGRGGGLVWRWWLAWLQPWVGISIIERLEVTTPDDFVFHETLVLVTSAIFAIAELEHLLTWPDRSPH